MDQRSGFLRGDDGVVETLHASSMYAGRSIAGLDIVFQSHL